MARDFPNAGANRFSCGNPSPLNFAGTAMSIHAWVKTDTVAAGVRMAAAQWSGTSANRAFYFALSADDPEFAVWDGNSGDTCTGNDNNVAAGVWTPIGGRKNGTGAAALAVFSHGVLNNAVTSNDSINTPIDNFTFGATNAAANPFDGLIAELAVWNIALTDAEFAVLAKGVSPLLIRPQNLKGYWPLWGTGSPEPDYSGLGSHATMVGTVNAGLNGPPVMPFVLPTRYAPTAPGAPIYEDSAEVYFDIQPSSVEVFEAVDAATIPFKITPGGTDVLERAPTLDAAEIYFKITPSGFEVFERPCIQTEGIPNVRFEGRSANNRFTGAFEERFEGVLEIGAATC